MDDNTLSRRVFGEALYDTVYEIIVCDSMYACLSDKLRCNIFVKTMVHLGFF